MSIRQTLFSNMFWRNVLTDFGSRSNGDRTPGSFTPYFQYKIGNYRPDVYLYFPKEPFPTRYKNEIFNKLQQYAGYDLIQYLEFHFDNYSNKMDFLAFLQYELAGRLRQKPSAARKPKLEAALEWAGEKKEQVRAQGEAALRAEITNELQALNRHPAAGEPSLSEQIAAIADKISKEVSQNIIDTVGDGHGLPGPQSGTIEPNDRQHEGKLIQLFLLIMEIKASGRNANTLFTKMAQTDIAAILNQHFQSFSSLKYNTVQKKVGEQRDKLDPNNPQVKKLTDALHDFFYK